MANNTISETTRDLTASFRQTNQALVDSLATAQDQNLRYAQSVFENGLELFKYQTESTRRLMQTLVEQSHKQQEVFWTFTQLSWQTYIDFLLTPLTLSREIAERTRSFVFQQVENAEREEAKVT